MADPVKSSYPTHADYLAVERDAKALRAQATRDAVQAARAYLGRKFAALRHPSRGTHAV